MILKASQRAGRGLAAHMLNQRDNDFVEVGRLRGFIATDIAAAFEEIEAISRATKCVQPFVSISMSPPPHAAVLDRDFEDAADMAMEKLGLSGQPHALIYHEKEGRRHAHLVVSRITPEIRAVNLSYFKERLNSLSRELYLSHGWDMPRGMEDRTLSDPLNFSLEEWQLATTATRGRSKHCSNAFGRAPMVPGPFAPHYRNAVSLCAGVTGGAMSPWTTLAMSIR